MDSSGDMGYELEAKMGMEMMMGDSHESVPPDATAESATLSIRAYLALNALVWIYALGVALVAKAMLRDWMGIGFVSIALPVGFALVSVLDYFYDRLSSR